MRTLISGSCLKFQTRVNNFLIDGYTQFPFALALIIQPSCLFFCVRNSSFANTDSRFQYKWSIKTISLHLKVNVQITLGSTIKTEILVSEESPYVSHCLCNISGQSDVAFRRYKRKCSEVLNILYTTFSDNFK